MQNCLESTCEVLLKTRNQVAADQAKPFNILGQKITHKIDYHRQLRERWPLVASPQRSACNIQANQTTKPLGTPTLPFPHAQTRQTSLGGASAAFTHTNFKNITP
jgi:hypothetical protein